MPRAPTSISAAPRWSACADLASVERLRESGSRAGLNAAQPHQREEGVLGEPVLVALRREALDHRARLALRGRRVDRDEEVGRAEIAVVLGDLVLEDQVV